MKLESGVNGMELTPEVRQGAGRAVSRGRNYWVGAVIALQLIDCEIMGGSTGVFEKVGYWNMAVMHLDVGCHPPVNQKKKKKNKYWCVILVWFMDTTLLVYSKKTIHENNKQT